MSKYKTVGVRVVAINDKFIIPDGDSVELTDAEVNHPSIQALVKAGELIEQHHSEQDQDQAAETKATDDQVTGDSGTDAAATKTKGAK